LGADALDIKPQVCHKFSLFSIKQSVHHILM
jgi:hypothetical protein